MSQIASTPVTDRHDVECLANVRPADWVNPEPARRYGLLVLGGGTAGLVSAAGAAILGARVALVERDRMGGDCLNTGCVPSKALLGSARVAATLRRAAAHGVRAEGEVDFPAVMERLRRLRAQISHHDSAERFRELGVDVFLGAGRFVDRSSVRVGDAVLRFRRAVIATGARPVVPPVEGLAEAGYLTHESVFELRQRPERLLVMGGGPIGCELAQAFARLGSHVTLVEMLPRLMPRDDFEAATVVARALERDGVDVRTSMAACRVTLDGASRVVELRGDGPARRFSVDEILVAAGRRANVDGLNLEAAGVEAGRSGVVTDDRLRTTNRRVYAAGDVTLRHQFTHAADASARIVLQNALFPGRKKLGGLTVPRCTYTDPEVAHVGLLPDEAAERGIEIETHRVGMDDVDRAIVEGEEDGFMQVHLRRRTDRIVGATIVSPQAGEMIGELTLAMTAGLGLGAIGRTIHPYPTRSEALRKIADARTRARLTPFVRRLLSLWLKR